MHLTAVTSKAGFMTELSGDIITRDIYQDLRPERNICFIYEINIAGNCEYIADT